MTDLEQFMTECEAMGKRSDRKRGQDRSPRTNSVERRYEDVKVDKTKGEIEAINADIIMSALGPDTLCWKCINARDNGEHSCEKFVTDKPIEGSVFKAMGGPLGMEYNIRRCPCFKFEYDRPQPLRGVVRILAYWCGVCVRSVWRHPERYLEQYNKMCPECQLTILNESEDDDYDDDIIE